MRFIRNLKACKESETKQNKIRILNPSELKQSEDLITISVQADSFACELNYVLNLKTREGQVPPHLCHTVQFVR